MSDKTDLIAAIALIRECTPSTAPWTERDFPDLYCVTANAIADILNAAVAGDLVPAARRPTVAGGNGSAVRGR